MSTKDSLPDQAPPCTKCGGETALMTFLPRFGAQPAYRLFECRDCKTMVWVPETDHK